MITFQGFGDFLEKNLIITRDELARLEREHGEYSCSIPSGVIPGKKWVRREPYEATAEEATWYLAEYGNPRIVQGRRGMETTCDIKWRQLLVVG